MERGEYIEKKECEKKERAGEYRTGKTKRRH